MATPDGTSRAKKKKTEILQVQLTRRHDGQFAVRDSEDSQDNQIFRIDVGGSLGIQLGNHKQSAKLVEERKYIV